MREIVEELRGIREHLAGLHAAAKKRSAYHLYGRLDGKRTLVEMHQQEFDKQALRWKVLQGMTQEEFDNLTIRTLERLTSRTRREPPQE
ncbi:hypothetical protein NAV33_02105 [Pseudomonas stutzeri]|uniref:hypothetical protein n=1 Tax=Stutzerimonas stutzeri TaxID=316 RepID=UPI002108CDB5|nr:hypothetical protein [Stutzerimonas stutzeri]MCQ4310693.1 hypothetical protein [Stutzerimonas stutzeri]